MERVRIIVFMFILSLFTATAFALPFNIVPIGTLPTTVVTGSTVSASYTVTNDTAIQRNDNFVKYLPPNVSIAAGGCGNDTFNLASGASCRLNLTISGAVDGSDLDPRHHLFVCILDGITCSGTTSPLNVTEISLVSLTVSPETTSVVAGLTQQYTATANYSDGSTNDVTASATWKSDNHTVATINSAGLATTHAIGTANITATALGIDSSPAVLTVTAAQLVSIAITPSSPANLIAGLTQQFTATGTYTDGSTQDLTNSVTWSSTQTNYATINSAGLATGVAAGATVISASLSGINSNNVSLTVIPPILQSISILPAPTATIATSFTLQFTATGHYSDGSTQNLTTVASWASSNSAAVTINSAGLATGVAPGVTNISATYLSITSNISTLTDNGISLVSIAITPSSPLIVVGNTQQFTATGTFSDSSTQNITNSVTWHSATPATAIIGSGNGLATGVAAGTTVITATSGVITSPGVTLTVRSAYFFITDGGNNRIVRCNINNDGTLSSCGVAVSSLSAPGGLAISPSGTYAYFTNNNENTLYYCQITNTGTFTNCQSTTTPPSPARIALTPSGTRAYIPSTSSTVSYCSINSNGSLTNCNPASSAFSSPLGLTTNPLNTFLYVADTGSNILYDCPINPSGTLGTCGTLTSLTPLSIALNPAGNSIVAGNFAYIGQTSGQLEKCTADTTGVSGTLTSCGVSQAISDVNVNTVLVNPSNTYFYALTSNSTGTLYVCPIVATTGALNACSSLTLNISPTPATLATPIGMAIG